MAGLRKDVELIFRGEDRASPSIKSVRKAVSGLTKDIDEQIAAAARGEGSVDELAKAYRGLKTAAGDVGEIAKIREAEQATRAAIRDERAPAAIRDPDRRAL
jgi:N-methylhydantoinase B/oxoprolinase/acetone carboxylase alpha subunit